MDPQSRASLALIAEAAMTVAQATFEDTQRDKVVMSKGPRDLVTTVDLAIEEAVRGFLAKETPEIGFLGEETGDSAHSEATWTLDPIDGTVNLSRGLPTFAISLALLEGGAATVAATSAPRLGEIYRAVRNAGATLNGETITVVDRGPLRDSVLCLDDYAPGAKYIPERARIYAALAPRVFRVRTTGSAALDLAWLAAGRVDSVIMLSNRPWDTAAGVLLAREAGAEIVDMAGRPHSTSSNSLLAGSASSLPQVLAVVSDAVGLRDWGGE